MAGRVMSRCIQLGLVSWINSSVTQCSTLTPPSEEILQGLPENIVPLKLGLCQVYLVGTNHISQKSAADVQRIVSVVKPDFVYLELCEERKGLLISTEEIPTTKDMVASTKENWKNHNILELLLNFYFHLVARELKVIPGSEFRIAYEEANKYGGKVVLGDRPIEVTTKRALRMVTLSEIINGLSSYPTNESPPPSSKNCSSISETIAELTKECVNMDMDAVNRMSQVISKRFPTLAKVFIHERDIFMAKGILYVAKESRCVVAVVGMMHLEGIKKHLQHQEQLDDLSIVDLLTVPPPKHTAKIITSIGVFMVGVAMIRKRLRVKI